MSVGPAPKLKKQNMRDERDSPLRNVSAAA